MNRFLPSHAARLGRQALGMEYLNFTLYETEDTTIDTSCFSSLSSWLSFNDKVLGVATELKEAMDDYQVC